MCNSGRVFIRVQLVNSELRLVILCLLAFVEENRG